MSRPSPARINLAAQVAFGLLFAGAIALSVSSCEAGPAVKPLAETSHVHYHVHRPGVEHGHSHDDFPSGGHSHAHEHPSVDRMP